MRTGWGRPGPTVVVRLGMMVCRIVRSRMVGGRLGMMVCRIVRSRMVGGRLGTMVCRIVRSRMVGGLPGTRVRGVGLSIMGPRAMVRRRRARMVCRIVRSRMVGGRLGMMVRRIGRMPIRAVRPGTRVRGRHRRRTTVRRRPVPTVGVRVGRTVRRAGPSTSTSCRTTSMR
ncbi:hypothetical protein TR51_18420 [Kitasatospora griseola]|uniref:Uncharacterized protein n=1 Tax=Kitasatospora griseola TaxID=2064 RepID=A0A0D0PT92_KITGR|nr:hypothetical protein TR51_18420 [Kitasatospora griseola]